MPVTQFSVPEKYKYLEGFGSYHQYSSHSISSDVFRKTNMLRTGQKQFLAQTQSAQTVPRFLPSG
jgi:hypothetical protein